MKTLTKEQAQKIVEITLSVYQQGNSWVIKELDLDTGLTRLTRVHTEKAAKRKLKNWRKERMEELLRADGSAKAYALRAWHENPSWNGEGVWQWAHHHWYTSREDAEKAMEEDEAAAKRRLEIFETTVANIPGHFSVAQCCAVSKDPESVGSS